MQLDKELNLVREILSSSGVRGFKFSVERSTDKKYGLCKISATWEVPLDEVLPEEYTREIQIETIELS